MPGKNVEENTHENINYCKMQKARILDEMRKRGCRITKQRRALLDIILENECSSCKEIYYKAIEVDRRIGTATVYRMVNILEEIGAISRKNMYKVEADADRTEDACIVVLNDHSSCYLSPGKWNQVMQEGLRACGYVTDQKVASIMVTSGAQMKRGI